MENSVKKKKKTVLKQQQNLDQIVRKRFRRILKNFENSTNLKKYFIIVWKNYEGIYEIVKKFFEFSKKFWRRRTKLETKFFENFWN